VSNLAFQQSVLINACTVQIKQVGMLPRKSIMNNLRHWFNCSNPWYLLCWHRRGIFSIKS